MRKILLASVLLMIQLPSLFSQTGSSGKITVHINNIPESEIRGGDIQGGESNFPTVIGKYYALIIGINDYTDTRFKSLEYAIRDAEKFYNALTFRYTFDEANVKLLRNATYNEIIDALDYFSKIVKKDDCFLIFYAGHGIWEQENDIGYWLPSDAKRDSKAAWFRNSALADYLRSIKSKHTLLITDACFAGSILMREVIIEAPLAISRLYNMQSRKAMTSGSKEPVPDKSNFLKYLVDGLLSNKEKFLSADVLYNSFRKTVINNSNVVPQFGVIRDVDDQGGEFVFILKR
jgi:hypothetical protein